MMNTNASTSSSMNQEEKKQSSPMEDARKSATFVAGIGRDCNAAIPILKKVKTVKFADPIAIEKIVKHVTFQDPIAVVNRKKVVKFEDEIIVEPVSILKEKKPVIENPISILKTSKTVDFPDANKVNPNEVKSRFTVEKLELMVENCIIEAIQTAVQISEKPKPTVPVVTKSKYKKCEQEVILGEKLGCKEIRTLGIGAFGSAFSVKAPPSLLGPNDNESKNVVLKTFLFEKGQWALKTMTNHDSFVNETQIFQKIQKDGQSHPNIIQFFQSFHVFPIEGCDNEVKVNLGCETKINMMKDESSDLPKPLIACIAIERAQCTLLDFLTQHNIDYIDGDLIKAIFLQIGQALRYLHETHRVTHNDLKWNNIVVSGVNEKKIPHLKLIDFGIAKVRSEEQFEVAEESSANVERGIPNEVRGNFFLFEANAFARMIIRYAVVNRSFRFVEKESNKSADLHKKFQKVNVEPELKDVILKMIPIDYTQRISLIFAMKKYLGQI
ncbi:Serine/threonine-protein kinase Nek10 [Blomia tropicalis]|nr:Serine/threonine-protein kinase Nek10 [Blomia tropicalis]